MCRWHATYHWKSLDKGYNFVSCLASIKNVYTKLWAPKVARVAISRILGPQLKSLETKWHLGAGFMATRKEYYKGEGGGLLQVRAMVSFVSSCLFMVHPCTKSVPTTCMSVWIIDPLVICLNPHPKAPARPSTPKVLRAREHASTSYTSIIFTLWTHNWVHQGVWGCVTLGGPKVGWRTLMISPPPRLSFYVNFHSKILLIHLLGTLVVYVSKRVHTTMLQFFWSNKINNIMFICWNALSNLNPNYGINCMSYPCKSMFSRCYLFLHRFSH